MSSPSAVSLAPFFDSLAKLARASGWFREVTSTPTRVHCTDTVQESSAFRIAFEDDALWVSWVTPDRYLSQSIESEVRWTGDDINELVEEEVIDQGLPPSAKPGNFEHFRSEDKLFTFRSRLPLAPESCEPARAGEALKYLLAYQAAFRNLGDMKPDDAA